MTTRTVTIGDCTLICGDSLDAMREIPPVDLIATDPPYEINYQSNRCKNGPRFNRLANDQCAPVEWIKAAPSAAAIVCFHEWRNAEAFRTALESCGWPVKSQIVWDRVIHGMGDLCASFAPQHDLAWWACRPTFKFQSTRPSTVLRFQRVDPDKMVHPTEKPVALMEHIIERCSPRGSTILDPFAGSFTTAVACIRTGRKFIGIELDEGYFEIGCRRVREEYERMTLYQPPPREVQGELL